MGDIQIGFKRSSSKDISYFQEKKMVQYLKTDHESLVVFLSIPGIVDSWRCSGVRRVILCVGVSSIFPVRFRVICGPINRQRYTHEFVNNAMAITYINEIHIHEVTINEWRNECERDVYLICKCLFANSV